MCYISYFKSPLGKIGIIEENSSITHVFFEGEEPRNKEFTEKETPLLIQAKSQLTEYFLGTRKNFNLPLAPQGSDFMQRDWAELQKIPYGNTCSYKDIATALGNPKACRAVGLANNRNPIAIIIPCHRVIGSNGDLVGYAGGLHLKIFLLELEKRNT
ncbi:MAG: methylated-DNA--[protein]-cysteine S-methyltransferase [Anaerovorax sp.]